MSDAPERIWLVEEDAGASWSGSFRRFHCSDLDHDEEGYQSYIRVDIAERDLAEARAEAASYKMDGEQVRLERDAAEAERDRLAAEVAHLRKALRDIDRRYINGADADTLVGIARLASATVPGEQP